MKLKGIPIILTCVIGGTFLISVLAVAGCAYFALKRRRERDHRAVVSEAVAGKTQESEYADVEKGEHDSAHLAVDEVTAPEQPTVPPLAPARRESNIQKIVPIFNRLQSFRRPAAETPGKSKAAWFATPRHQETPDAFKGDSLQK